MTHPNLLPFGHPLKKAIRAINVVQMGTAIFSAVAGFYQPPSILSQPLGPEAYAQHRPFPAHSIQVRGGGMVLPHTMGAARQNHTLPHPAKRIVSRCCFQQRPPVPIPRLNLRVTHASRKLSCCNASFWADLHSLHTWPHRTAQPEFHAGNVPDLAMVLRHGQPVCVLIRERGLRASVCVH